MSPMRIVFLTNQHHPAANYILTHFLKSKKHEVVGIVADSGLGYKGVSRHLKKGFYGLGLFLGLRLLMVLMGVKLIAYFCRFFKSKRKLFYPDELADKYDIPLIYTENINSKRTRNELKKLKPDLLVSNCFSQILKKPALTIPKISSINIHPGLLPGYKGLFPYFWAIFHNEKLSGVTIHEINEKIDEGRILAQKSFRIKKKDCAVGVSMKSGKVGFKLLKKLLPKIKRNYKKLHQKEQKQKHGYYNIPNKQQLSSYLKRGKEMVNWRSLMREY